MSSILAEHPLTAASTIVGLFLSRIIARDYSGWLSVEAGGLPNNFLGYIVARILTTQGQGENFSTTMYDAMMQASGQSTRYITEEIGIRAGRAPQLSVWAAPIRQINCHAADEEKKALDQIIVDTVASSSSAARLPSRQEGGHCDALWASPAPPSSPSSQSAPASREIYHFHDFDGSAHATVSPADAKYLLDRGWGERHPLSGVKIFGLVGVIPATYVAIYAPRNAEERHVHELVAKAALEYALAEGK